MESIINAGITVKVGLDDRTFQLAERFLGILGDKSDKDKSESKGRQKKNINKIESDSADNKTEEPTEEDTPTLEQLRAELSEFRERGDKELIKEILNSVGVKRLPDVKVEDYGKLMQKIKEMK